MFKGLTKQEKSWILYDLAESPYTVVMLSTIMGIYFLHSASSAVGEEVAAAYWGLGNTVATVVTGLLAPIIGTLTGYKGKKKLIFNGFVFLGIFMTMAIAFIPEQLWLLLLVGYIASNIGFSGANKVYDAFLVDVSENEKMDRVSSLAFGVGYIGCTPVFIASVVIVALAQFEVIGLSLINAYRISFLLTALWWIVFSLPMFRNVHQLYGSEQEEGYIRKSFVRIWTTFKEIKQHKAILLFLIAFFFYSDGVSSIIRMATVYGSTIGIDDTMLLLILLVTQFVAAPFAVLYGRMADKFGTKNAIYCGIGTYIVICLIALFMNPARDLRTLTILFWSLAMLVGTAQGGIQALSRSYFGKIIPKEKSNEFFGFYNIFGRFASVIGTTLFGVISLWTGQPHFGIAGIAVLFVLAAIIFKFVPSDEKIRISEKI